MRYKELEERVLDFADNHDRLNPKNLGKQANILKNDALELHYAVTYKEKGFKEYVNLKNKVSKTDEDIKSRLGKLLFDLIILAEIEGVSLEPLLEETLKIAKNK